MEAPAMEQLSDREKIAKCLTSEKLPKVAELLKKYGINIYQEDGVTTRNWSDIMDEIGNLWTNIK